MIKQTQESPVAAAADAQAKVAEPREGAQSKVFDHGDYVLKVLVPPEAMLAKARANPHPWFPRMTLEDANTQHANGIEHHRTVERYLANCPELRRLCADFTLLGDDRVRQRKVEVLDHLGDKDRLHEHEAEIRRLIDDFAALHLALWRHGACELDCSALTNCGRDPNTGELLLIDVGNLSFRLDDGLESVGDPLSVERATEYMKTDKKARDGERLPDWFTRGQLRECFFGNAPALFEYYISNMSSMLTQEALKNAWPSASRVA